MKDAEPVTTLGHPKVVSSRPLNPDDARFVEVNELTYRASNGAHRRWEATNRKTRSDGVVADAVDIFTRISHPKLPESTIIVLQFRPPVDAISVEFPAGLIDAGESPEDAALRELAEETGYGRSEFPETHGKVVHVSKPLADSPGMSTETTVLVTIQVDLASDSDSFPDPRQKLDEGEFIEKRVVPIQSEFVPDQLALQRVSSAFVLDRCLNAHYFTARVDLYDTLLAYQRLGYIVDTRLHHLAYGLQVALRMGDARQTS